jgi:tRNA(fMet)-specific endonuclease VapC
MTRYLLDANVVIGLLNDRTSRLAQRARQHQPMELCLSSIVAHKLFYGAFSKTILGISIRESR